MIYCIYSQNNRISEVDVLEEKPKYLLMDSRVLPDVFCKVVYAKRLLAKGKARSSSEAAKMADISRQRIL